MTGRAGKSSFAARPRSAEVWIKTPPTPLADSGNGARFTARLTIDVTPELRGRIKIVAFGRGQTVADMLRDLLAREYPEAPGDAP